MTFDPSNRQHLDLLFNMTQRGPFSGYTPDQIAQEASSVDVMPGSTSEDTRWPVYLQGYVFNGIYNGDFTAQPPDGVGSYVNDVTNKLPGWNFVDGTTDSSGTCYYEDTGSSSHGRIAFGVGAGLAVADRVYVEQLVYAPYRGIDLYNLFSSIKLAESGSGYTAGTDFDVFMEVDWIEPDGTVDDTETQYFSVGDSESGANRMWFSYPPTAAAYAKIRIGFECLATGSLSGTKELGTLGIVDFTAPLIQEVTLQFTLGTGVSHKSTSASTTYTLDASPDIVHNIVAKYRAPAPGFFMQISAATDANPTAGKAEFKPVINGTAQAYLGDPNLSTMGFWLGKDVNGTGYHYTNHATQGKKISRDTNDTYDFLNGDNIQMQMITDGSWSASSGCYRVTLTLALIYHEAGNKYAGQQYDSVAYRGG